MEKTTHYRQLPVWQKSVKLASQIYALTRSFPKEEMYGLVSQMRRASVSIPSNIAEGNARRSFKEYAHFLSIAMGSAAELETQMFIAFDLKFIDEQNLTTFNNALVEIGKMLYGIHKKLS